MPGFFRKGVQKMGHSKLPWQAGSEGGGIHDGNGDLIGLMLVNEDTPFALSEANALFVDEACNNYERVRAQRDELLGACERVIQLLGVPGPASGAGDIVEMLEGTLAQARGDGSPYAAGGRCGDRA